MKTTLCAIVALFGCLFPYAVESQPLLAGVNVDINDEVRFTTSESAQPRPVAQWTRKFEALGTRGIQLEFINIDDKSTADYTVEFRSRSGNLLKQGSLSREKFRAHPVYLTPPLLTDYVEVQIVGTQKPVGLSFVLKSAKVKRNSGAPFSITIPDEREQIIEYEKDRPDLFKVSRAVAKLSFLKNGIPYVCTGFMISENMMLTNEHCINSASLCATAYAMFDYVVDRHGTESLGESVACLGVHKVSANLDAALLRLEGEPGKKFGIARISRSATKIDNALIMVQHPAGEAKQVSRLGCIVSQEAAEGVTSTKTDFAHKCDTLGGSSGSPIFDDRSLEVVGLHHFGFGGFPPWTDQNRAVHIQHVAKEFGLQ